MGRRHAWITPILAAFRGQTVRVRLRAALDGSLAAAFRVDDVSLR